ncbi:MAG TPA: C39 family peptidase [Ktedonobacteraceae bacterium]|jgi:hypothetical protein|nr:C39 family peptidase [Ktedonobacteraceae bacterium]
MALRKVFHPRNFHFKRPSLARILLTATGIVTFSSALAVSTLFESKNGAAEPLHYNEFWRQERYEDFQGWTRNGIALHGTGSNVSLLLAPGTLADCNADVIAGGTVQYDHQAGLCLGHDPYEPGTYGQHHSNYYNGGDFYFGTLTSPIHVPHQPITTLIPSWNASTPPNTWLELQLRVRQGEHWSKWYSMGIWAGKESTITRHTVDQQRDANGTVATDTFTVLGQPANAYQLRVTLFSNTAGLSPVLWRVYAIASADAEHPAEPFLSSDEEAWGMDLEVPQHSQMLAAYSTPTPYGQGNVWCSPTSLSMLLAYWAEVLHRPDLLERVPTMAAHVYDATYEGTGNWPFNMAYAAEFNLRAYITRMYSFNQVEKWIQAGVPLAISISYGTHQLPNSPIPSTPAGHLLVVRGFTANGDVITNDPVASTNEAVQITYNRYDLAQAWLNGSHGLVYVVYPENWPVPESDQSLCW